MIERHAFGTLRDIGRELDALGITVRDQFGKSRKASDFTDTLIKYIEIQEAKVSRSETDLRVREAIESVWVPLFVVPWVVGACAIVAIGGNTLYRLFLLVL